MSFSTEAAIFHSPAVRRLIDLALEEDLSNGDATAVAVNIEGEGRGEIVAKAELICAGLPILQSLIDASGFPLKVEYHAEEGAAYRPKDVLAVFHGPAAAILEIERTALNFLQRLCGIATLTRRYVDHIADSNTRVSDTRKTLPGWRTLDKYAVKQGGGSNHRFDLGSGVLIKDNHIAICGSVSAAVEQAKKRAIHSLRIEVEVETLSQLYEALEAGADIVLLDNMTPEQVMRAVEQVDGKALVEVSGGITLDTIADYSKSGADIISVGALTHSAVAVDISLDLFQE